MEKIAVRSYGMTSLILGVEDYGPDPVILRKRGVARKVQEKFDIYKRKIEDPNYMEYAINKIAVELTHFLSK